MPREHRVEHGTQRVHVAERADALQVAGGLLGRHVARRAEHLPGDRVAALGLHALGQAEVGDLRRAAGIEQHVAWLEVAMDHPAVMGVFDRHGDLAGQTGGLLWRQRPAGQPLGQAIPFDEAHRVVMTALVLAELENRHDARMLQLGGGRGLGVEAFDVLRAGETAAEDHLQGHHAVEPDLAGLEDDAHAAASDLLDQLVVAEQRALFNIPAAGRRRAGARVRCAQRRRLIRFDRRRDGQRLVKRQRMHAAVVRHAEHLRALGADDQRRAFGGQGLQQIAARGTGKLHVLSLAGRLARTPAPPLAPRLIAVVSRCCGACSAASGLFPGSYSS